MEKKLQQEQARLQQTYPEAVIQLWSEDEHRLGLKPIRRRIYVPEGDNPIASVHWRYQWLWVYTLVEPSRGETEWWILPCVNTTVFSQVLAEFAKAYGIHANKRILLVVDQAGWHRSEKLQIPEGIHLFPLPPYTPELQPAERLWGLVDEPIANRTFTDLSELEQVVCERCQQLLGQKDLIRGLTNFHWWDNIVSNM